MNASNCQCDTCGTKAHAIVGTFHRRCGGKGKPPKAKHDAWSRLGRWQAAKP